MAFQALILGFLAAVAKVVVDVVTTTISAIAAVLNAWFGYINLILNITRRGNR